MNITDLTPPIIPFVSIQTNLNEHKHRPIGIATRIERVSNIYNVNKIGPTHLMMSEEQQHFDMLFERCINTATDALLARNASLSKVKYPNHSNEHKNREIGITTRIERVSNSSNMHSLDSAQLMTPEEQQHFDMLFERCINVAKSALISRRS